MLRAVQAAGFAAVYLGGAELGHFLSFPSASFATFWPPSGIYLTGLLRCDPRARLWLLTGALMGNLTSDVLLHGQAPPVSLAFWLGNTLEALSAAALLQHLVGPGLTLGRVREVLALVVAAMMSCSISATIGTVTLGLRGVSPDAAMTWGLWWSSDVVGCVVFGPVFLTLGSGGLKFLATASRWQGLELGLLVLALAALSALLFAQPAESLMSRPHVLLPFLLWGALRFGPAGAALVSLVLALVAVGYTVGGSGTFALAAEPPWKQGIIMQAFLVIWTVGSLLLAASLNERRLAEAATARERELLRAVLDSVDAGVVACDQAGRLTVFNRAAMEVHGLPAATLRPEEWANYYSIYQADGQTPLPADEVPLYQALHGAVVRNVELVVVPKGQPARRVNVSGRPTEDIAGRTFGAVIVMNDITELRKSEADALLWKHTFEWSELGIAIGRADSATLTAVNPAFARMHGATVEELTGAPVALVFAPEVRGDVPDLIRRVNGSRGHVVEESLHVRKDGTIFPVMLDVSPVRDASGRLLCRAVYVQDITERKKAEAAMRKLAAIVEASDEAIIGLTAVGVVRSWNRGAERLTGYAAAEAQEQSLALVLPAGRADEADELGHRLHQGESIEQHETTWRRKDGRPIVVSLTLSPIRDSTGQVVGGCAIVRDVTQRKRAEEKFRRLVESAPDAIVITDEWGKIVLTNWQTERLFGYERQDLVGRPVEVLMPERFREEHLHRRDMFLANPQPRGMGTGRELFALRADGREVPVEISLSPLHTDEGLLISASIRDVSERQKTEAAVRASLREKEVLLREIHHRVKNNLAVVCSLLYLQSTRTTDPAMQRILQESQDRVRSMALVHESLYRSDNLAEVNFGEYAENLIASLFRAYGPAAARLTVQTDIAPVRLTIERAVPLGLVLNELMTNALKHAFPGDRSGVVRAVLRRDGDDLCLCVSDNGVGLPPGFDLEHVPSLGLRLIQILTRQLDGHFRLTPANPGAEARLTLRRPHERSPS